MKLRVVFAMLVLSCVLLVGADEGNRIDLLRTGSFHGDEVPFRSGETWMALVQSPSHCRLEPVRVLITPVQDLVLDVGEQKTGRAVAIEPNLDAIVLLRGSSAFKPSVVPTVANNREVSLGEVASLTFEDMRYDYVLRHGEGTVVEGRKKYICSLSVETRLAKQELAKYTAYEAHGEIQFAAEEPPLIIWAGDLDGDKKLDLLLQTADHYNVSELSLFLSSHAEGDEVMHRVAVFQTVGC